ncbi:MAG: hypothetical protein J0I47_05150 [Sphingomonas sp.]|uniref:hypothetical protein n=1 Tax=Sphingomonas sp. TaxID=28214 RepID=UPI001AD2FD3F|nr:hypothetical protein [Sphingomonas sp.]MBN8807612.1 hypothetical protein [Sphingomonas sp.]
MSEPKPFASLSSGLLARKGQARPAMRPQAFTGGYASLAGNLDDLGWNDMGHAPEYAGDVHPIEPQTDIVPPPEGVPPVLAQRRQLHEELAAPVIEELAVAETPVPAPAVVAMPRRSVSVATAKRLARETQHKNKAAFTLRLDQDRHLRLRLASAVSGHSAQMLVTEALDAFLTSLPEVDDLARQVPARASR